MIIKFPMPVAEFIRDSTAICMPIFLDKILRGRKILINLSTLNHSMSPEKGSKERVEENTMMKSRIFQPLLR
jgi:hypothetical protein